MSRPEPSVVLRIAGPIQSWAGYRLIANSRIIPTAPVPRKSGIAGLLGAALGRRDLDALANEFTLHARIDRSNSPEADLQVLTPWPDRWRAAADRGEVIRTAGQSQRVASKRSGGSLEAALVNRDFLPHAEFIITLTGHDAEGWVSALREPAFMPYLGRKPNPPTFPFVLGVSELAAEQLLLDIPRVPRHDETDKTAPSRIYRVDGGYTMHNHTLINQKSIPTGTREEQLTWAQQHLN